ncbi:MAG: TetR/AcrR family transcriptional regulator [Deltaproteobacteria bacterium]|nr:TetR/AcrR family transcriptional regulator [Deltaproteobacteria bacterium]MBW1910196.1 TetR/AcrR family transcriptional regulator [Deltaproteobacteria bacterium]MBW2035006.1 TetR/AcrR family transcriptional regulator [Deltaproteobacteria bacterium]
MRHQGKKKTDEKGVRDRLLEAATALFAKKGYASTYVREIVTRAGVTKPALYYYFKNKGAIFCAILDSAVHLEKTILAEVLEMEGPVLDSLTYLYRRFYQGVIEQPDLARMINNLISGAPQGTPTYDLEQFYDRMVDAIKTIYLEGVRKGEVKEIDVDDAAILFLSLLDFCLHMDLVDPESSDLERPVRLLRIAFQGLAETGAPDHRPQSQLERS